MRAHARARTRARARTHAHTRGTAARQWPSHALALVRVRRPQEDAAQNCSMPYRAPELFDLPSDATIDERTDVFSLGARTCTPCMYAHVHLLMCMACAWHVQVFSLGATLYAMAFYYSPFECTFQENTQRVVECSHLRVIGGAQFPADSDYSPAFVDLIQWMLTVDPKKRPTVHQVLSKVKSLLR